MQHSSLQHGTLLSPPDTSTAEGLSRFGPATSFFLGLAPKSLPARLLCPWDFPGKNTRVGCHFLLQGIFATQGSKLYLLWLLHCRLILYYWATGKPIWEVNTLNWQATGRHNSLSSAGFTSSTREVDVHVHGTSDHLVSVGHVLKGF